MFSDIVVPLDGSREANIAVPHACLMARVSGATVTLLRVVSSGREVPEGQAFLDSVAREYAASDVTIDVVARNGHQRTSSSTTSANVEPTSSSCAHTDVPG